jgi:hypothetical protein
MFTFQATRRNNKIAGTGEITIDEMLDACKPAIIAVLERMNIPGKGVQDEMGYIILKDQVRYATANRRGDFGADYWTISFYHNGVRNGDWHRYRSAAYAADAIEYGSHNIHGSK